MAREHFWAFLKDQEGRPLVGSDVRVYLAGTANEAVIFSTSVSASGAGGADASLIDQSTWVTGASGFFNFFVGNEWETENGYSANQQFRLKWSDATVTPSAGGEIDNLTLFDFIFPVDETSTNIGKNKLVSNTQADTWTEHIGLTYAHEIHNWESVQPTAGTLLTENRLVSDLLMYTVNEELDTLLTCGGEAISITASGSLVDVQTIGATAWAPSADGSYYADVTHRLVRNWMFPVYQIYNTDTRDMYWPVNIKDIDLETIRLWSNDDTVNLKMTIVGELHSTVTIIGVPGNDITSGQTYSASSNLTTYVPSKAFDDILTTANAWIVDLAADPFPIWLQIQFSTAQAVMKLRLYPDDAARAPKDFTLKGSNTGSFSGEETTVLTVAGATYSGYTWNEWEFTNWDSFLYYRIVITDTGAVKTFCHVLECEMMVLV